MERALSCPLAHRTGRRQPAPARNAGSWASISAA